MGSEGTAVKRRRSNAQADLSVKVAGPGVGRARISVPDLLKICEQVQAAVNRQAEALEGLRSLRPGPYTAKTKIECTLDLLPLKKGSTVLPFAMAKPQMVLSEVFTIGIEAI